MTEVTQADRDAAADYWRDFVAKVGECMVERSIRRGDMDEDESVQRFARHRINTRPASTEPVDALAHKPDCEHPRSPVRLCDCPAALTRTDALAEAREALTLARNRLQSCAVEATVRAMAQSYEWAEWAADADAALSRLKDRDEQCFDREVFRQGGPYGDYWSPHASMVSSIVIHEGRTALERRGSE